MKVTVDMRVAVHPIKAKLWESRARLEQGMTLREIGALIKIDSPQQIKHHLEGLVKMGSIDYIHGEYVFPGMYGTE
jgi:hypothetical protein